MTVRRVPLFPLSTVLFPNMVLSLHIFEPRYRELVNRCVEQDIPFGVLLIKQGPGPGGYVEPHPIGTMARITDVDRLDDGRINVVTVGVNRFRLHGLSLTESYLTGEIEFLEEVQGEAAEEERLARRVRGLFQRYATLFLQLTAEAEEEAEQEDAEELETATEEELEVEVEEDADADADADADTEADDALAEALRAELQADSHDGPDLNLFADRPELPRHPGSLAYSVAAMASWTTREKQELLEFSTAARRLEKEATLLRRDVASMEGLRRLRAMGGQPPFIGPCSTN